MAIVRHWAARLGSTLVMKAAHGHLLDGLAVDVIVNDSDDRTDEQILEDARRIVEAADQEARQTR